eukprot:2349161-Pyramimonas_sp.AAC.1
MFSKMNLLPGWRRCACGAGGSRMPCGWRTGGGMRAGSLLENHGRWSSPAPVRRRVAENARRRQA